MFKKFKTSIFAAILIVFLTQQSAAQFFKTYDFAPIGTRTEIGYSLEKTATVVSSWSIAGVTNSTPSAGGYDWLFMRLNSAGTVSCKLMLGFSLSDSAFTHVQLSNGRNVVAGFYRAPNGYEKASWSMIDTSCSHIMSRQIVDSLQHQFRGVTKNPSDAFTLAGWINNFIPGTGYKNHILAAQYSPAGALLWAFNYTPPYPWIDERAYSICYQPTDGSYAITGITNRFTGPTGPYQVFIMKISAAGIPVWYKGYSPMPGTPSQGRKIIAMPDGGFTVTGFSNAFDAAFNDYYVLKVTSAGLLIWMNTYGLPGIKEESYSIVYQPTDMTLVFTGLSQSSSATEEVVIAKITAAAGFPVWTKIFPNASGDDRGYDIETASPSGFGVTGQYFYSSSLSLDPFLTRPSDAGFVAAGCNDSLMLQPRPGNWNDVCARNIAQVPDVQIQPQPHSPSHIEKTQCGTPTGISGNNNSMPNEFSLEQNYPNPFNPSTKISYSIKTAGVVNLSVYNTAGELVKELVNKHHEQGSYEITFDAANLSTGIYFYTIEANDGFTATKKMVLVK